MNDEELRGVMSRATRPANLEQDVAGAIAGQDAPLQRSPLLQAIMSFMFGPPGVKNATINFAGPVGRLGTPDELAQALAGLRNVPGAQREALLRSPRAVTIRPDETIPGLGRFTSNLSDQPAGGTVKFKPGPNAPAAIPHEVGHAMDVPNLAGFDTRSFGESLAGHPAARPIAEALLKAGYKESAIPREIFAMAQTPPLLGPHGLGSNPIQQAMQSALQDPRFQRLVYDVLARARANVTP